MSVITGFDTMKWITRKLRHSLPLAAAVLACLTACCAPAQADITADQRTQLKALASDVKEKTTRERRALWQSRTDLMNVYQSYRLNDKKALATIDRINRAQLNLLNIHLDSQVRLRHILNSQQFHEFRSLLEKSFGPGGRDSGVDIDIPLGKLPDQQMLDKLGLSSQQRSRARVLTRPSPELVRALTRLRSDSQQMAKLYNEYNLDTAAAKKLIASIHNSQREVSRAIYHKQKLIRSVLTESQFEKYRAELNRRMSAKPAANPVKRANR